MPAKSLPGRHWRRGISPALSLQILSSENSPKSWVSHLRRSSSFEKGRRRYAPALLLAFIHRSAWNRIYRTFISRMLHSLTPVPLKTPAPGTLHSPAPVPLVTPMDTYARSWMSFLQTNVCTSEREHPTPRSSPSSTGGYSPNLVEE